MKRINLKDRWIKIRKSSRYHDFLLFMLFVVIATIFWFIIVINDNVEQSYSMRLNIQNKPDSITFINTPPENFTITIRDKGTKFIRTAFSRDKAIDINFPEYAQSGILKISNKEFYRLLRNKFGPTVNIISMTPDSLRLRYTVLPGKRVPIDVISMVTASLGNEIAGTPIPSQKYAIVYSDNQAILDTIYKVQTQKIVRKDLKETTVSDVKLVQIPGARVIPSSIKLTFPVEALVNKRLQIPVSAVNVPANANILLFPSTVEVSFYIPLSKFDSKNIPIKVTADINSVINTNQSKVAVKVANHPQYIRDISLKTDSVEYTIVRAD